MFENVLGFDVTTTEKFELVKMINICVGYTL